MVTVEAAQHARGLRPRIQLLGSFCAFIGDEPIEEERWPGRRSMELVQLLALAEGHRLPREQAIEALWPHLDPEAGAANLRKAAHHARKALSAADAVVLRAGSVALFPSRQLEVDAERFEHRARDALRHGDPGACAETAETYGGELLPGLTYEEWTQEPRRRLRALLAELLRRSGRWERLVELEPTEEQAYLELIREALAGDRRHDAIRWYGRLRTTLASELGVGPSREASELYAETVAGLGAIEPAFLDRQIELARAAAALRDAGCSRLGAVLVRGSPGIGKSAFCRRLVEEAEEAGWATVSVTGARWRDPYEPIVAAVEEIVGRLPELPAGLGDHARSVLAALTSMAIPAPRLDEPLTRHKVIGAFQRLLAAHALATGKGLALVVDDAHTVDDATIDVLCQLASGPSDRLVAILAYRAEAARETLRSAAAALARRGGAVEINLGPLEAADARALAAVGASRALDDEAIDAIVRLGRGNPFFILELSREAPARAPLEVGADAWGAIQVRFLDLDRGTVSMLSRLAVAGDDLDLGGVLALTGLSEADAFELLDRALDAGVLTVAGPRYSFRHEIVRQALVESLPQHRRISIHRDAARRLAGAGAPAPQVARHWMGGERPDEAIEWQLAAAREASEAGAFADALRQLDPLLAHSPGHVEALSLRAEALEAQGDDRAPAAYAAAAAAAAEPLSSEIRAKEALARLKAGDPERALLTLSDASPATTSGRLAEALTLAGAAAVGFGDPELAATKAEEMHGLALELGDPGAVAEASWARSLAAHARGELRESLRADVAATGAVPELAIRVFDGYLCASERMLHGALPYAEVIEFADLLAAEAERRGAARGRGFAVTLRGMAELLSGSLGPAETDLDAAARLHHKIGAPAGEALALQQRAQVEVHRGQLERAAELADEALAAARESSLEQHLLDRIYGSKLLSCGHDPVAVGAALDEAEAAIRGPAETCPTCRIALAVPAAIAAARAGELERARVHADTAESLAMAILPLPGKRAEVEEVKGHLARAGGSSDDARAHFEAAATGFRVAGQPLDAARCAVLATGA